MSWWVSLVCDGRPVEVEHFTEGGTYPVGGSTEATLNVTYNYAPHFYRTLPISKAERFAAWLTGKTGAEVAPHLRKAVEQLGTVRDPDYWKSTPGNAGYALSVLLKWAEQHPNAVFDVS